MLTLVTTCKGRLAYLRQSLPAMLLTGFPVVVVDYDCPNGSRRYVAENFPQVRLVAIDNEPMFNVSRARNLGAANVTTKFIGFFDCDALLQDHFAGEFSAAVLADSVFCVAGEGDLYGQCIVPRAAFERVGGYDEAMTGWAGEDGDFYLRLQAAGYRRATMRPGLVLALPHGDDERIRYTGGTPRVESHRLNATYAALKRDIEALQGGRALSHDEKLALRDRVAHALRRAAATGKAQTVEYRIRPNIGAAGYLYDGTTGYRLNGALRYKIEPLRRGIAARLLSVMRPRRRQE